MTHRKWARLARTTLLVALALSCGRSFRLDRFPNSDTLFQAAMREYQARRWANAVAAFEKLTLDLPARDTLLPLAHFYLAKSHLGRREFLLAAQSFKRLAESFATDTLADDAQYEAARAYHNLWRKPQLDPNYGELAAAEYQTLIALYPDSELKDDAERQIRALNEWFAIKDYDNGLHYLRRKAYDSAIIYFKDVVERYPDTRKAREAYIRLAEAYDVIRWREDKQEVCTALHQRYPRDREVVDVCGPRTVTESAKRDTT
ncbi:MAG: outer membrane protein assembly factor BamD [Gemmatimonadaceae bacterium]